LPASSFETPPSPEAVAMAVTLALEAELFKKMLENMDRQSVCLEAILTKIAILELRQSRGGGEPNDSIRAMNQWAIGASSCITEAMIKAVSQGPRTYYEVFADKDKRRCEYEIWKFFELAIKKNEYVASDSQHSTGECFRAMPSVLKLLHPGKTDDAINEMLEAPLKLLYKLIIPLNRQYAPMTSAKMVEHQVVPKSYKTEGSLSEDAAKEIWQNLCESYPECKIVDKIPINVLDNNESWHQQLIRKICLYNMHKKAVHIANGTLSWTSEAAPVITPEMHEDAKQKHLDALDRFWVKNDAAGKILIDRAAELKDKQWAASEKAKKEKQEDAKGSEGDQ